MKLLVLLLCFSIKLNLKVKWIHAVGKEAKGDDIGTALYNMQVTSKSMLRPQKWFFNVMTPKPSIKYIKEAEENGLKYQIEELKSNLEEKYNDLLRDKYDQRSLQWEQKSINKYNIARTKFSDFQIAPIEVHNVMKFNTTSNEYYIP